MSRSLESLKRLRIIIPPQLEAFAFSLFDKPTRAFFSLFLCLSPFPLLGRLYSKTLRFLSSRLRMDSSYFLSLSSSSPTFADDDYDGVSSVDSSPEPLFLVPLGWWSEANAALYGGGSGGNKGVLYNVMSSLSNKKLEKDDFLSEVESEIVLDMTRVGETGAGQEESVSCSSTGDLSLALISEWMFLRAFKW